MENGVIVMARRIKLPDLQTRARTAITVYRGRAGAPGRISARHLRSRMSARVCVLKR